MTDGGDLLRRISSSLSAHGLILRGGFNFGKYENAPPGPSGQPAHAVVLVGQAGAGPWPHFSRWRQNQPAGLRNPLDAWSREVIDSVAEEFDARAVAPSEKPYLPFQQWAIRAEGLKPSPLGILMHPEYGLWHAYRGALLFERELRIELPSKPIHLCDLCDGKPCLKACPVDAYSQQGFAYDNCRRHVSSDRGEACRTRGCLDRNACPFGTAYRYPAVAQAFHMAAFSR